MAEKKVPYMQAYGNITKTLQKVKSASTPSGRRRHPGVAELDRHVANAVAKPTPRGWRLVKSAEAAQVDAVIALAMAAERATQTVPQTRFFGWL